jgi:raffinose/stachyose/melibiose transport system permease protein
MGKKKKAISFGWILAFFFAIFWLFVTGLPFYYLVITSFKSLGDFLSGSLFKMPATWELSNYIRVFQGGFLRYLFNSITLVVISLAALLFLASLAAYPLSRMTFKLNKPIYSLIVAAMSVPLHITLIPLFIMAINTKLYNTLWALVGPNIAFNLPMSVFILVSFMHSIPKELEESAEIDG